MNRNCLVIFTACLLILVNGCDQKESAFQPGYSYMYNLTINSNEDMSGIQFGTPSVDTYVNVVTNFE